MHWLNSPYPTDADPTKPGVARGDCSITSGKPADVERDTPGATVTYSNIKTGPIGSTYSGALQPGGGSSPGTPGGSSSSSSSRSSSSTTTRATTTTAKTTTTTTSSRATTTTAGGSGGVAQKYAQCGVSIPLRRSIDLSSPSYRTSILTFITGTRLHRTDRLRQRIHLRQDQRLVLAVLVNDHDEIDSACL
jgi:hypothetical protein